MCHIVLGRLFAITLSNVIGKLNQGQQYNTLLLEQGLEDKVSEELTPLIKSKSMTRHKKSNKSSKYKDPNLSRSNGHESRHLEVACE